MSGGHGAISSLGSISNGIEIWMRKMNTVSIAPDGQSATIGGGGYIVYQMGDSGGVIGGHMPASMQCAPDMFKLTGKESTGSIGFGWAEVEGNANLEGHLSINVPGVVSAMCESHKLFGSMPLTDVLAPAIKLAKEGFSPHWHNLYAFGLLADILFKYEENHKFPR